LNAAESEIRKQYRKDFGVAAHAHNIGGHIGNRPITQLDLDTMAPLVKPPPDPTKMTQSQRQAHLFAGVPLSSFGRSPS
jgi:hypothetical protein